MAASGDIVMKVLVLGDPATGKTSAIKRTITNSFSDLHKPTIGVDFHFRKFVINGVNVALQLWDIAGQDRFGAIYRVYYKESYGAVLVFDLTRPETFQSVLKWKREIDSKVTLPNGKPLPVLLLANKCDLPDHKVDKASLDAFCAEHGFIGWFETSAKENVNIEESVTSLINNILGHKDLWSGSAAAAPAAEAGKVSLDIKDGAGDKAKKGGCC